MSYPYGFYSDPSKLERSDGSASLLGASSLSEKARVRFAKEGRGTGAWGTYVPGRTFRELRGVGRMHRFSCSRCGGRQIVLPSDMALATFLDEHWDRQTRDLREYFPLMDVDETVRVARSIGVRHPTYRDGSPRILTTDLLVFKLESEDHSWAAVQSVSARSGESGMSSQNLIVREFWRRAGVPSRAVYSLGLNSFRIRNLWLLFGHGEQLVAYGLTDREQYAQEVIIRRLSRGNDSRISDACGAAARASGLTRAECARAVLQLIACRAIECPLDVPILLEQPTGSIRIASDLQQCVSSFVERDSDLRLDDEWAGEQGHSKPTKQSGKRST
ncbi:hypothetical protein [Burkholderia sp. BE17]|uniref:hypothetical protein n=1 Tax=Burkholderia sp. BE17 TaxID=2656644 RepID=UPI00128DF66C|nr:hypothetical protein [Burkholderia sp. BE17]MPV66880.1 hypothetical protein [Burkholderia sp. BE17]